MDLKEKKKVMDDIQKMSKQHQFLLSRKKKDEAKKKYEELKQYCDKLNKPKEEEAKPQEPKQ